MTRAKAKTINLLLEDGSLDGIINIEASSWNSGELYSSPRSAIEDLLKQMYAISMEFIYCCQKKRYI